MDKLTVMASPHDFTPVRRAMQRYVDQNLLAGVSWAILRDGDVLDTQCVGYADKENEVPLRPDHIFRAMSNTKLVTCIAVLLLCEEGKIQLDDPIGQYIAPLAQMQVLKPGATRLDDTEPARRPITIRHLMTHSSGLSYGLLDPGTMMFNAYAEHKVLHPGVPLSGMMDVLASLPLAYHPGESWEYSVAIDVLGRLVEVVSGQSLDQFFQTRIFDPLGMRDTGFVLPPEKHPRLSAYYAGADLANPMLPGLTRLDKSPYPDAYLKPFPKLNAGGGLVSTLHDMVALVRSLQPSGKSLLKPDTLLMMRTNQLPAERFIRFPQMGEIRGKGHGLAGAVTLKPSSVDPAASTGELQWGGMAGTHWWISPHTGLAGVAMAQRFMGFWHPYAFEFKQLAYQATGHG